jgi:hypothetical protein
LCSHHQSIKSNLTHCALTTNPSRVILHIGVPTLGASYTLTTLRRQENRPLSRELFLVVYYHQSIKSNLTHCALTTNLSRVILHIVVCPLWCLYKLTTLRRQENRPLSRELFLVVYYHQSIKSNLTHCALTTNVKALHPVLTNLSRVILHIVVCPLWCLYKLTTLRRQENRPLSRELFLVVYYHQSIKSNLTHCAHHQSKHSTLRSPPIYQE